MWSRIKRWNQVQPFSLSAYVYTTNSNRNGGCWVNCYPATTVVDGIVSLPGDSSSQLTVRGQCLVFLVDVVFLLKEMNSGGMPAYLQCSWEHLRKVSSAQTVSLFELKLSQRFKIELDFACMVAFGDDRCSTHCLVVVTPIGSKKSFLLKSVQAFRFVADEAGTISQTWSALTGLMYVKHKGWWTKENGPRSAGQTRVVKTVETLCWKLSTSFCGNIIRFAIVPGSREVSSCSLGTGLWWCGRLAVHPGMPLFSVVYKD